MATKAELRKIINREREARIEAQNDAVKQSLIVELARQDVAHVRRMVEAGACHADILKFIDTPEA